MTFQEIADLFGMPRERVEAIANAAYECFAEGFKEQQRIEEGTEEGVL